jgi:hypothetical protein
MITDKIGSVAYKLKLPDSSSIHPVFHVSQLKITVMITHTAQPLPSSLDGLHVLSKFPRNGWPRCALRCVFKLSSSGLAYLLPWRLGRTWNLLDNASLELQLGGKLALIREGMLATLRHRHQAQAASPKTRSRYVGLGAAQGSDGPVHEPKDPTGCEATPAGADGKEAKLK